MDTFFEQIVKKKKSFTEWLIILGGIAAGIVLIALSWIFLGSLGAIIIVGVLYGAWWLITMQNKEYEYCVTNGDIDIDLIIARRSRKRIVSVVKRKIEVLAPYSVGSVRKDGFSRIVIASESEKENGLWYFTYHSKKNGHTLVVFHPNERVLNALKGDNESHSHG